jgi:hypothetical protein
MHRRFRDQAAFLAVYVRENHSADSLSQGGMNDRQNRQEGLLIPQPRSQEERAAVAHNCCGKLDLTMPMVVDDVDDHVAHEYSGLGQRLYLLDSDGLVAYKSGRGPYGFVAGELEQSLLLLLWDEASRAAGGVPGASAASSWMSEANT